MSADTVTNFISPTKDVLTWVSGRLNTYVSWNVSKYPKPVKEDMFKYLLEIRAPAAVAMYLGSTYTDLNWRRNGTFAVVVMTKDMTDVNAGSDSSQDLLDKAISLLDHEIYEDLICRVAYDKPLHFPYSGLCLYEVGFKFDDH